MRMACCGFVACPSCRRRTYVCVFVWTDSQYIVNKNEQSVGRNTRSERNSDTHTFWAMTSYCTSSQQPAAAILMQTSNTFRCYVNVTPRTARSIAIAYEYCILFAPGNTHANAPKNAKRTISALCCASRRRLQRQRRASLSSWPSTLLCFEHTASLYDIWVMLARIAAGRVWQNCANASAYDRHSVMTTGTCGIVCMYIVYTQWKPMCWSIIKYSTSVSKHLSDLRTNLMRNRDLRVWQFLEVNML